MSTVVDSPRRVRPSREQIEPAAIDLIRRYGGQIMSVARRYSQTPEDAEDAYQRGLEILLTKAPSTHESDLVPWLKTVVKHEAFALRSQRARHGLPTEPAELDPPAAHAESTHERAERYERLQVGAEALRRLKPQEIRCLVLLAEGYSYAQIQAITGFSYTKVNRCLAEGRRSFMQRVSGIESGEECERLAPLVSAVADGEADADDLAAVRRHLRGCLSCRAALRESREVPARVAALAPIGALAAVHAGGAPAAPHGLHAAWAWLHERATTFLLRGQDLVEAATAHKAAAVAASAAAIAGGGVATMQTITPAPHRHHQRAPHRAHHVPRAHAAVPPPRLEPVPRRHPAARRDRARTAPAAAPAPVVRAEPKAAPSQPAATEPGATRKAPQPNEPESGEFGP